MLQYNESLLTKQEGCKHFISRQLEVSGRNMTEDEVNEMVASGKWEVFNENLLNDAKITRSQLSEIEQRHKVRKVTNNSLNPRLSYAVYCLESLSLTWKLHYMQVNASFNLNKTNVMVICEF